MCIQILNVVKCCSIEPKYKREVSKIKNLCDKRPFNVTNVSFFFKKKYMPTGFNLSKCPEGCSGKSFR